MTISHLPLIDLSDVEPDWADEVVDLTDRRRLLLRAVFGVELSPEKADAVFAQSSTTMRSGGRSSSTDDR